MIQNRAMRNLAAKSGLPTVEDLEQMIVKAAISFEIGERIQGENSAQQMIRGLCQALVMLEGEISLLVKMDSNEEAKAVMAAAFSNSFLLYQTDDKQLTLERALDHFRWPVSCFHESGGWYPRRVLIAVGHELGHLRGREQELLRQMRQTRQMRGEES